jgi:hypothetical protein
MMPVPLALRLVSLLVLAGLAACGSRIGPRERVPARLVSGTDTSRILLADTAVAGHDAIMTFNAFGGGCIGEQGPVEVTLTGTVVDVRPFAWVHNGACPDILRVWLYDVALRFPEPGTFTVRLHGITNALDLPAAVPVPITLERNVHVVHVTQLKHGPR